MAIILGILIAYTFATAPLFIAGYFRMKKQKELKEQKVVKSSLKLPGLEHILTNMFVEEGMKIEAVEFPENIRSIIVKERVQLTTMLKDHERAWLEWFQYLREKADANKLDMAAVLQGTEAITKAMIEIKNVAEKFGKEQKPRESIDNFVNVLNYARDKYATSPAQKKAITSIISTIKTSHGTESK